MKRLPKGVMVKLLKDPMCPETKYAVFLQKNRKYTLWMWESDDQEWIPFIQEFESIEQLLYSTYWN